MACFADMRVLLIVFRVFRSVIRPSLGRQNVQLFAVESWIDNRESVGDIGTINRYQRRRRYENESMERTRSQVVSAASYAPPPLDF